MWSREYFGLTNGGEEFNPGQSGWPLSGEAWEIYPVTEYDDVIKDIMYTKVQAPPVHSQHMQVGQQLQGGQLLGRDGMSGGQGDAREGNLSVMMPSRTSQEMSTLTHSQCIHNVKREILLKRLEIVVDRVIAHPHKSSTLVLST